MTNQIVSKAETWSKEIVAAAAEKPFHCSSNFAEWLRRWKENDDADMACGLLHQLFDVEPTPEANPDPVAFLIELLKPLPRYPEEKNEWVEVQRKGASVVVNRVLKKKEKRAPSLGMSILKYHPEMAAPFLAMLAACRHDSFCPMFFRYDENDSSTKIIQDFITECGEIMRGVWAFERREQRVFAGLAASLDQARPALFWLFLEHKLDRLCLPLSYRNNIPGEPDDGLADQQALAEIALSPRTWGVAFKDPSDALARDGLEFAKPHAAAVQWSIINATMVSRRRARQRAGQR